MQAFTTRFAVSIQLYRPRRKTAHRTLQRLFLRFRPLNRPRYQTDTSGYNTTCATLEGITAPGRAPTIPDTTAMPGRCTGQHRPPIIIRYIRVQQCVPCYRSMPARRGFDASHARRLAIWHRVSNAEWSAGRPPPGGAVQRQGRGGRRGTINGYRRISFQAFAR